MAADKKPTLKELRKYVAPHVGSLWEDLGIELNLDEDGQIIDSIAEERAKDESKCCLDVLKIWLQGKGEEPKTYEVLIRCLREVGAENAIESIHKNILESCTEDDFNEPPLKQIKAENLSNTKTERHPKPKETAQSESTKETELDKGQEQPPVTNRENEFVSRELAQVNEGHSPAPIHQDDLPSSHQEESQQQQQAAAALCDLGELPPPEPDDIPKLKPSHGIVNLPTDDNVQHEKVTETTDEAASVNPVPQDTSSSQEEASPASSEQRTETDFSLKLKEGREIRNYQKELAQPGINGENYIICAPTGTGKTLVAGIIIADSLQKTRGHGKVIFMVNTKPLAQQQKEELEKMIPGARVECCTGDDGKNLQTLIPEKEIVVCTAGKLLNELQGSNIKLRQIELLVIDECHHTIKGTPQARVMQKYLRAKSHGKSSLPQVIGLTASPGAGDNPRLELEKTLDHLSSLCALMDATSGIKRATKYAKELERHTNKPQFTTKIEQSRKRTEPFIVVITDEMTRLEPSVGLNCPFDKWSQEYETFVQQRKQHYEMSTDPESQDPINTLEVLRCYTRALHIYMDLRYEDAVDILDEFHPPQSSQPSLAETDLVRSIRQLKEKISELPKVPNPLLQILAERLRQHFTRKPDSKGIIFVRTKRHAAAICKWIEGVSTMHMGYKLNPKVITGHTHETGLGMTQVQQTQAIRSFHQGEFNLLVATSVAEEGLDVPACNLVIRFQHVSNEIAKVQTRGRARAVDSEGFTILSMDSKKNYREFKNSELEALVDRALALLPDPDILKEDLRDKQRKLIQELRMKNQFRREEKKKNSIESVQLKCKRCKTFACQGTDIYTMENSTHHIIPDDSFRERIKVKKRPPHRVTESSCMVISDIMCCKNCDAEWGIICQWPSRTKNDFPVLKCKQFIFEIKGQPRPIKKWSDAPFEIPDLSEHPDYCLQDEVMSSDSDDDSD